MYSSKIIICSHRSKSSKCGLCALRHGIQNSMEAILACHPALSVQWLDLAAKCCDLWRNRRSPIWRQSHKGMRAKKTQSLSFSRESSMYTSVMRTIGEELQQPEKKNRFSTGTMLVELSLRPAGSDPEVVCQKNSFLKVSVSLGGFGPSVAHGKRSVRRRCVQATKNKAETCSLLDAIGRRSCGRRRDWV